MQSNDLNKLISDYKGLNEIYISGRSSGKTATVEELKSIKQPISTELLIEVRGHVERFQNLGKSRRWIRRWVKRKYNITEY